MIQTRQYGPWEIVYDAFDGGRIGGLSYNGQALLTVRSDDVHIPVGDFGQYETRPAYGYDDCFPTVDPSHYPRSTWEVPDHGELCWLPWKVEETHKGLSFSVESQYLPVRFRRILHFSPDWLTWHFEVIHTGDFPLSFQHVMHALLPLEEIKDIGFPSFLTAWDDVGNREISFSSATEVKKFLFSSPEGKYFMFFLRDIDEGMVSWQYRQGLRVEMVFDNTLFPAVGIWWNRRAWPDEDHARRCECAFEPTPGYNSNLGDPLNKKKLLTARPGTTKKWTVQWNIYKT